MTLHVSFIEPKSKFIDVAAKMFWAGVMINANQSALENGKDAFNPVRGDVVTNKFVFAVIDCVMTKEQSTDARVGSGVVGMQCRANFHMLMNFGLDSSRVRVLNLRCDRSATPLAHPKDRRFADCAADRP